MINKKEIKRLKFPMGPTGITVFQLRDGVGIKLDSKGKKSRKHLTMLADAQGRLGTHVTDERFPHKHPKRNRSLWKVEFSQVEKKMESAAVELGPLIAQQMPSMLNPDLTGAKLLVFPFFRDDALNLVEVQGQNAVVQPALLNQIRIIDPDELDKNTGRAFLVLRKARVWWHGDGLLFKAPNNVVRIVITNSILAKIAKTLFDAVLPPEFGNQFPPKVKFRDSTIQAWQLDSVVQRGEVPATVVDERKKLALISVSSHMMLFKTGFADRIFGGQPQPPSPELEKKDS